jgi:hypothetical protein
MNNPDVGEFVVELERALAVQASRNQSLAADLGRG